MKSISASLVVLSGAVILATSGPVSGNDRADIMLMLGSGVVLIGLVMWVVTVFKKD